MAYIGTKGWYISQLKEKGIHYHPSEKKKLELYKTSVVRNLYLQVTSQKK